MFYLVLAICASALISIMMRLSEGKAKNAVGLLAVNYFTCLVLSLIFTYADASDLGGQTVPAGLRLLAADARTLALGALNGTFYLSTFLAFQYNIRKNGVVLPSTFAKLGVLVPTLAAIAVFGERPDALQITGVVLAVAAIIYMNSGGASGTAVSSGKALILLLILGGTGDTMSKVYQQIGSEQYSAQFLLYTFTVAFVLCAAIAVARQQKLTRAELLYGVLVGVPNFFCSRLLLRSLSFVPASIAYPTYSVGVIVIVAVAGVVLFREEMNRRQRTAIGAILIALVLLNR